MIVETARESIAAQVVLLLVKIAFHVDHTFLFHCAFSKELGELELSYHHKQIYDFRKYLYITHKLDAYIHVGVTLILVSSLKSLVQTIGCKIYCNANNPFTIHVDFIFVSPVVL